MAKASVIDGSRQVSGGQELLTHTQDVQFICEDKSPTIFEVDRAS